MSSDFFSIQVKTYLDSLYVDNASNGGRKTRKIFYRYFLKINILFYAKERIPIFETFILLSESFQCVVMQIFDLEKEII